MAVYLSGLTLICPSWSVLLEYVPESNLILTRFMTQNVANTSRRSILAVLSRIARFDIDAALQTAKVSIGAIPLPDLTVKAEHSVLPGTLRTLLAPASSVPVKVDAFDQRIQNWHGIAKPLATVWDLAAAPLIQAYRQAITIAGKRSSHLQAYEAAIATLSHGYLAAIEERPDIVPSGMKPHHFALEKAIKYCGFHAPPKADLRFRVEAIWATINIRFILTALSNEFGDVLSKLRGDNNDLPRRWSDFVGFILESIQRDAELAIQIAEESQSHRQVIKTVLLLMEADYQTFSHHASRQQTSAKSTETLPALKAEGKRGCATAKKTLHDRTSAYCDSMDWRVDDQQWVLDNFSTPAKAIIDKWVVLIKRLEDGFFYTGVSDDEKRAIVRALTEGMAGGLGLSK
jgi:hypothetical protein